MRCLSTAALQTVRTKASGLPAVNIDAVRERVERLIKRMPATQQYPTQGCVLFVDLEKQTTARAYLPAEVVSTFLSGRGGNMWLLYNLVDDALDALDPNVPLIFGTGVMTGMVPSAARGNVTSR